MKAILCLIFACLSASIAVAAERVENLTWLVGDSPIVKLDTFRGDIRVEASDAGHVDLVLRASSPDKGAQAWMENIQVKTTPFGAGLVITVVNTRTGVEFGLGEIPFRSVELTLRVPKVANLDLRAREGSIEIGHDFEGQMRARLDAGNVFVGRVKGSVVAHTGFGSISVSRTMGNLSATTRHGDIMVGTVGGWAQLRSESGDIEISDTLGGIDAVAQAGSVKVSVEHGLARDSRVSAKAGDIELSLNPKLAVQVDAKAVWGKVASDISFDDVAETPSANRVHGNLNGGGAVLALSTRGGNVSIDAVPVFEF